MTRLVPRSLLGQVMLALAAALLVAQGVAAALLYRAADQRREIAIVNAAAVQLIGQGGRPPARERIERRRLAAGLPYRRELSEQRLPRMLRFETSAVSPLLPGERRDVGREAALRAVLSGQGEPPAELVVTERLASADPLVRALVARRPALRERMADAGRLRIVVAGMRREGETRWQIARVPRPPGLPALLPGIVLQTVLLFAALFGLMYLLLRRITRPLAALAERTDRFANTAASLPPLVPSGPDDVSRLIAAHNAMEGRIGAMLDEKDVMLGAIGHDLKTPLAALRVRVEDVADPAARSRTAATIEDIARTLDDILALARVGRRDAAPERTDLAALVAAVAEEFEDMGAPVTLHQGERLVAPVHVTWLKRGLRNLVENAVRYGGTAEVTLTREGTDAVLRVADRGPGIPEDRIAAMLEPFARGEASRNRETGGAGLGLALARAVADKHGGGLALANRPGGGLIAELRIPL